MTRTERKLTGWHVLAIFVGAFTVIIGVNLVLAFSAVRTFPGLEVDNSYVASQTFDNRRKAQEALGWTVKTQAKDGLLSLAITDKDGRAVQAGTLEATLGRATERKDDRVPDFAFDGTAYVARETLAPGKWDIRLKATALDGTLFQQRLVLFIPE